MDGTMFIAHGNLVFIVKLEASSSINKLKLETWGRRSSGATNKINIEAEAECVSWVKSRPTEFIFASALKRGQARRRILDARAVEGNDGLTRVHILVSSKDSSQLLQIRISSTSAFLVDLGSLPEFQAECRLLDGPSVLALQKDKLLLWIVESKSYAVSSSLLRCVEDIESTSDSSLPSSFDSRFSKNDESKSMTSQSRTSNSAPATDWRLSVAVRLGDSAIFVVVLRSSSVVVADVFMQNNKRISPLGSKSAVDAVPQMFRRSMVAVKVVDCGLIDEETFESDLFIATTQRSVFRVKNGSVLSYASVATLGIRTIHDLSWEFLSRNGEDKLVVCNRRSKDVAVLSVDKLAPDDNAAASLAIKLAAVDDFQTLTYSCGGNDEICLYGVTNGAVLLSDVELMAAKNETTTTSLPPVGESTRKALMGFRNVVQTGTAVLERNERKLNDKVALIKYLLRQLDPNLVSLPEDVTRNSGLFRLGGRKLGRGMDKMAEKTKSECVPSKAVVSPILQFGVKNQVVILLKVEGELAKRRLFVLGKNSTPAPFRCKLNYSEIKDRSNTSHVIINICNFIAYGPTIDFSLMEETTSAVFRRLFSGSIDLSTLKPLALDGAKPDAFFLALKTSKIGVSIVLLSVEVDLPANHYLFEEKLKFGKIKWSGESIECFSMADASSPLSGCVVSAPSGISGECSERESRFHLYADSLTQIYLFAQKVYEVVPMNCLIVSEGRFRRRFRRRRSEEELTTTLKDCLEERRKLFQDNVKPTFNKTDNDRRESLATSLKVERAVSVGVDSSSSVSRIAHERRNSEVTTRHQSRLHDLVAALDST